MSQQRSIRILSASDVRQALPMKDAIEVMKSAFVALSRAETVLPLRSQIDVPKHHGTALFMPAYWPTQNRLGLKVVTLFDQNIAQGLPRIQSVMLLVDGSDGSPLALLDGASLTAIRTGAASGAATDLLARKDATQATIYGAGVQGRTQLEAICCARSIRRVFVVDPHPEIAESFAREMSERLDMEVLCAVEPSEAIGETHVICTATPSATPVFEDRDLPLGVHINAIGSYQPHVQEIPEQTVARARIVVDHRASVLEEAGDLIVAIKNGLLKREDVNTELGDVICGSKPGRCSDDEITLFKSVGVGVQDVAAAAYVYERALQLGLGVMAPL